MINLFLCNGKACVWNAKDVMSLRNEHRIVGSLIGNYPDKPFQIQTKWLPLQLLNEETSLLIEKGIAQLVSLPKDLSDPTIIQWLDDFRNKSCEDQIQFLSENRKQKIIENIDEILKGKKRKRLENHGKKTKVQKISENPATTPTETKKNMDDESNSSQGENSTNLAVVCIENVEKEPSEVSLEGEENVSESQECNPESINIDKSSIIDLELSKAPVNTKEACFIQLFTECPWKTKLDPVNWKYPSSEREKLRYAVYKDLWEKKYYITSGVKFGGDFLAYGGDPLKYHASFIIVCMCAGQKFQGYDIVTYGRLGHQVKKTVALASLNEQEEVDYITINWENELT